MTAAPAAAAYPDPLKEAIRRDLEATRLDFHRLLHAINARDFGKPSANPAWTVAEILFHMSVALRFLPADLFLIRRLGRTLPLPGLLFHRANEWFTRWGAREATHATLAAQYDAAHARTLGALAGMRADEWHKGATYPGWDPLLSGVVTLETLFRYPVRHFQSHARDLRRVLDLSDDLDEDGTETGAAT